jgi:AcrR family transcriptional regulator
MSLDAAPPRSARKAKGQGAERREEILDHAQRLFAAHGVQSVSTRQIAEAVGISQPTLYAYFPRKSDILDEVGVRAFARLEAVCHALRERPGQSLADMVRAYIRFGLEEPDSYRIAFMIEHEEADGREVDLDDHAKPGLRTFGYLREALAERLGAENPDLEIASQSLWAGMHGLVALLLARSRFPWTDRERLIAWHVDALIRGLPLPAASEPGPTP